MYHLHLHLDIDYDLHKTDMTHSLQDTPMRVVQRRTSLHAEVNDNESRSLPYL